MLGIFRVREEPVLSTGSIGAGEGLLTTGQPPFGLAAGLAAALSLIAA